MRVRFSIKIDSGDTAFDEFPREEIARILSEFDIDRLRDNGDERILHDANGNRCGAATLKITGRRS